LTLDVAGASLGSGMPAGSDSLDGDTAEHSTQRVRPAPHLFVREPESMRGETFPLDAEELVIGRSTDCDVRLADDFVSRRHATIRREPAGFVLADADSTAGIELNDVRLLDPALVYDGDRIRLGRIELELRGGPPRPSQADDVTRTWEPVAVPPPPAPSPRYRIENQRAENIHIAGRDQYIRKHYELVIKPMRRRARRLLRVGLTLLFAGVAVYAAAIVLWGRQILDCIDQGTSANAPTTCDLETSFLVLVPIGLGLGLVGIVLIISSLLMRRRARREEDIYDHVS
jgi:hypothetical protein